MGNRITNTQRFRASAGNEPAVQQFLADILHYGGDVKAEVVLQQPFYSGETPGILYLAHPTIAIF